MRDETSYSNSMENLTAYIMCGPQGGGKSSKAKEIADLENAVIIDGDEIKKELYGSAEVQGNWIEINDGLKYQIIGNSNYGKPLLNRNLTHDTSLKDALKMGFLSFDATQVSTNDVDYPIDVVVYEKDSFKAKEVRLYKEDMQKISDEWNIALKNSLESID